MSGLPSPRREKRVQGRSAGSFPEERLTIEPRINKSHQSVVLLYGNLTANDFLGS